MSHRQFLDTAGVAWEVWDVRPDSSAGPAEDGRGETAAIRLAPPIWHSPRVDGLLAQGWLCFQSVAIKRRLAPIPDGWQDLDVGELERLCGEAAAVQPLARSATPAAPA